MNRNNPRPPYGYNIKQLNIQQPQYDPKKGIELFNIAAKLDIFELLQFANQNNFTLNYVDQEGDSLINFIIKLDSKVSENCKLDIIKNLIKNEVDPDKPNKQNQTALHLSCKYQYEKIIKFLVMDIKVDINFKDLFGQTALYYLLEGNIIKINPTQSIKDLIQLPKNSNYNNVNENFIKKTELFDIINNISLKKNLDMCKNVTNSTSYNNNSFIILDEEEYKKIFEYILTHINIDIKRSIIPIIPII